MQIFIYQAFIKWVNTRSRITDLNLRWESNYVANLIPPIDVDFKTGALSK